MKDTIGLLKDLIVPEPEDFPAERLKVGGPRSIALRAVLTPVCFDDELAFDTGEIGNAPTDGHLLSELELAEPSVA